MMVAPQGILVLAVVSLLLCAIGFVRFVWFMSVGYGLSVAGIGTALLVTSLVRGQFSLLYTLLCVLLIAYGVRLGGFLLWREMKNASYREKARQVGGDTKVPVFVAAVMWICCGLLYLLQTAGPIYRLLNSAVSAAGVTGWIGLVIAAAGFAIEALADKQKGEQKKHAPDLPAMEGLYKLCRCPNYFGELLFWGGIFCTGIGVYQGWQWLIAILGLVTIVWVMVAGAKRMETRHIKNYGKRAEYKAYADSVPLLFPLVPIYHMTSEEQIAKEEAAKAAKKTKR